MEWGMRYCWIIALSVSWFLSFPFSVLWFAWQMLICIVASHVTMNNEQCVLLFKICLGGIHTVTEVFWGFLSPNIPGIYWWFINTESCSSDWLGVGQPSEKSRMFSMSLSFIDWHWLICNCMTFFVCVSLKEVCMQIATFFHNDLQLFLLWIFDCELDYFFLAVS